MRRTTTRTRAGASAVGLALVTLLALAGLAAPAGAAIVPPPPSSCPPVLVRSAEVVRTTSGPAVLVRGVKPHADTRLHLAPDDIAFVQQPAYWPYTVRGCGGTGPVRKVAYSTVFRVSGPVGRYGIEVHGIPVNLPLPLTRLG